MNLQNQLSLFYSFTILILLVFTTSITTPASSQNEESINWLSMEEAQAKAAEDGKKVFVFVEAEWCGICRQMERQVFPDDDVKSAFKEKYYLVTIDLDSRDYITFNGEEMTEREFARRMNVSATPTSLFIDPGGGGSCPSCGI